MLYIQRCYMTNKNKLRDMIKTKMLQKKENVLQHKEETMLDEKKNILLHTERYCRAKENVLRDKEMMLQCEACAAELLGNKFHYKFGISSHLPSSSS
jgi:hypothetical protein